MNAAVLSLLLPLEKLKLEKVNLQCLVLGSSVCAQETQEGRHDPLKVDLAYESIWRRERHVALSKLASYRLAGAIEPVFQGALYRGCSVFSHHLDNRLLGRDHLTRPILQHLLPHALGGVDHPCRLPVCHHR